jgi:hypothetical protein
MPNAFLASAAVMTAKRNPETPSGAATLTPGFANANPGYTVIAGKLTI